MINVLAVQFKPDFDNKLANFKKVSKILLENKNFAPDFVILPECFNIGYHPQIFHRQAEFLGAGETTMFLSGMAATYNTNIAASFIEKTPDEYKNTLVVFDRSGKICAKYSKIHLFNHFDNNEKNFVSAGNEIVVADLDFAKVGLSVCYDLRFPELYRTMQKRGAEMFINLASWAYCRNLSWKILNQARAIENHAFMFSSNAQGGSILVSPTGEIMQELGEKAGVLTAQIDILQVNQTRRKLPVFEDRREDLYE